MPERRHDDDPLVVHEGAVRRAETLDDERLLDGADPRVLARDLLVVDDDAVAVPPEDDLDVDLVAASGPSRTMSCGTVQG